MSFQTRGGGGGFYPEGWGHIMCNILFTGRWVYNESGLYKRKGLYVEVYNYDIRNDFEY